MTRYILPQDEKGANSFSTSYLEEYEAFEEYNEFDKRVNEYNRNKAEQKNKTIIDQEQNKLEEIERINRLNDLEKEYQAIQERKRLREEQLIIDNYNDKDTRTQEDINKFTNLQLRKMLQSMKEKGIFDK